MSCCYEKEGSRAATTAVAPCRVPILAHNAASTRAHAGNLLCSKVECSLLYSLPLPHLHVLLQVPSPAQLHD